MKHHVQIVKKYIDTAIAHKKLFFRLILPVCLIFSCIFLSLCGIFISIHGSRAQTISSLDSLQRGISEELVRLHVIANSDSDFDQATKLKVKDHIVTYLHDILSETTSKEETLEELQNHLSDIEQKANEKLQSMQIPYRAKVRIGRSNFPIKVYGDITLPAGEYDALRIELGDAVGQNWWCIVFPNLCYVDATYQIIPEESKDQLKYLLTEDEYDAITKQETKVVVKFKLWEWLKGIFS